MKTKEIVKLINSVKHCYSNIESTEFSPTEVISDKFQEAKLLENENLDDFLKSLNSPFDSSLIKRTIAVDCIKKSRDSGLEFNHSKIWNLLTSSILELDSSFVMSSLGSQGFLSIPISRIWSPLTEFDMVRIHIWDPSLDKQINQEKVDTFSIHCHKFHAHSWIMNGNLINSVYKIQKTQSQDKYALFKIERGDSQNAKSHTSIAVNTNTKVNVILEEREEYKTMGSYQVPIGTFHKSKANYDNKPVITIFSFTARNKSVLDSFVVGPNRIENSEVNRKAIIDPKPLINQTKNIFI